MALKLLTLFHLILLMKYSLLFIVTCFGFLLSFSQQPYIEDKTPRLLFPLDYSEPRKMELANPEDNFYFEYMPRGNEEEYKNNEPIKFVNLCEVQRYKNGALKSRCECLNNQLHGKAVFWDETGRIETVQFYRKGRLFQEKKYSEGILTDVSNYTYRNEQRLKHGSQIEIRGDEKTIHNFNYDVRHGIETETIKNIKTRELLYDNGTIIEGRWWKENGVLLREEFNSKNGSPIGTWYKYDGKRDTKTYTTYEKGKLKNLETFKNGICIRKTTSKSDESFVNDHYYDNGSKFIHQTCDSLSIMSFEYYDESERLTSRFIKNTSYLLEKGFHFNGESEIRFETLTDSKGRHLLHCYTIVHGDTTSFFYAHNEGSLKFEPIATNNFVQKEGIAVKHGEWLTYANNKLLHKLNFNQGILHGASVYFDTAGAEPTPYLHASYNNGLKHGEWLFRDASKMIRCEFDNGVRNGKYENFNRIGDTLYIDSKENYLQVKQNRFVSEYLTPTYECHFINDSLNGPFVSYHANGSVHWKGSYVRNDKSGLWEQFDTSGTLQIRGSFENGSPQNDWTEPILNKRGKLKYLRIEPPTEIISDTFLLNSGNQLNPK